MGFMHGLDCTCSIMGRASFPPPGWKRKGCYTFSMTVCRHPSGRAIATLYSRCLLIRILCPDHHYPDFKIMMIKLNEKTWTLCPNFSASSVLTKGLFPLFLSCLLSGTCSYSLRGPFAAYVIIVKSTRIAAATPDMDIFSHYVSPPFSPYSPRAQAVLKDSCIQTPQAVQ